MPVLERIILPPRLQPYLAFPSIETDRNLLDKDIHLLNNAKVDLNVGNIPVDKIIINSSPKCYI